MISPKPKSKKCNSKRNIQVPHKQKAKATSTPQQKQKAGQKAKSEIHHTPCQKPKPVCNCDVPTTKKQKAGQKAKSPMLAMPKAWILAQSQPPHHKKAKSRGKKAANKNRKGSLPESQCAHHKKHIQNRTKTQPTTKQDKNASHEPMAKSLLLKGAPTNRIYRIQFQPST